MIHGDDQQRIVYSTPCRATMSKVRQYELELRCRFLIVDSFACKWEEADVNT